jgi:hypothetical protein
MRICPQSKKDNHRAWIITYGLGYLIEKTVIYCNEWFLAMGSWVVWIKLSPIIASWLKAIVASDVSWMQCIVANQ